MSATCPFCGAKLNLGLRFCVVCGRHVTNETMGKFAGLKGGFRPADITRRLDEMISAARFKKSRRSHEIERGARWAFVNTIYLLVATGLFYSAIQFSLETMFPGKFHHTRIPVGQILTFLKQPLSPPDSNQTPAQTPPKPEKKEAAPAPPAAKPKVSKSSSSRAKRKVRGKRSGRRGKSSKKRSHR
ncbi:MAG: hypothetical protein KC777_01845 [Cyanobacteria bacterium HKST-UBA02]|nr:hypothetical protein [Cyanobacteria bacterium HKST-UBA02]